MKKILLFAFTMLSMSGIAQHVGTMKPIEGFTPKTEPKFEMAKRIDFSKLKPTMQTKDVTEPEGTKTSYFLDYYDYAYEIGYCMKSHVTADIYIADDGTVSISNMFFTNANMFGNELYITGKLNEAKDSIIIDNNQLLGTLSDGQNEYKFYICNLDTASEAGDPLLSRSFALAIDPQYGIVHSDMYSYLGLYVSNGTTTEWYSDCTYLTYMPVEYFPEAVTYDYTFLDYEGTNHEATVDIINMGSYVYISSLMPQYYPEAWLCGEIDNNNIILYSAQIATDDIAFMFANTSLSTVESCTMTYNASDNSYISESGIMLMNMYYNEGYFFGDACSNMVIKQRSTAVNTVEAGNKVVASTEYYDLSGRRIVLDDTTKGMCIKVVKYTDGTSDAIKMMR